jgi:broad specificity phosphatase PhoE
MTAAHDAVDTGVTLYLVRHGAAEDAAGRCVGRCDLALSPEGQADVARLARAWPAPRPPRIVTSDLARARASAESLTGAWGLTPDVKVDARLREMHFGSWDGRAWADIERDDAPALGAWMASWQDARTPGGEGFPDVVERCAAWLGDAVAGARAAREGALVVVAHAGSIRALLVHALALPRALAFRVRIDHARVSALRVVGEVTPDACAAAELLFLNADRPPSP